MHSRQNESMCLTFLSKNVTEKEPAVGSWQEMSSICEAMAARFEPGWCAIEAVQEWRAKRERMVGFERASKKGINDSTKNV